MSPTPLAGLRVLELARILAGPWAGQTLADLGADVIKVERTGGGDDTRAWGPPFITGEDGTTLYSAYYHSCNRGKRSIAVDFEQPEGQAIVRALAEQADVVIENFKVGGLVKYGLDHQRLAAANPKLITCSITGFGQDGPAAHRPGYDFMIQGMGGIMDLTGTPDGEPMKIGVAFADIFTGLYAVIGIQAALAERAVTGRGRHVDMSLLDTQVAVLANQGANFLISGNAPTRMGNAHPNIVPYQVFPTADSHIIIATGNDRQWAATCRILGVAELAEDPRFRRNADRVTHRDVLMPLLFARSVTFSKAELLAALEAATVPAGPINTVAEVFDEPQVVARGLKVALPATGAGLVPGVRSPLVFDGVAAVPARGAPRFAEHTRAVLAELGYAADAVAALAASGVISVWAEHPDESRGCLTGLARPASWTG
jgi:crotonobetainyl-CoA:carnitine CoA-transferase CaiB-like acyl-CoA transferase